MAEILNVSRQAVSRWETGDASPSIDNLKCLSILYKVSIDYLVKDNEKHHKPHVHVYYGEYEASVALDGEMLEGKLPLKQYRMISGWMALHEDELYMAWNNAVREKPFSKIEPLK